ncbi:MAG: 50S ribosomal protein L19 [Candidatus Magasanikbacteria bacterium GW2011_GWD2_43_18]|nr:MAG: 50S ribosomal protein L19 [Candidatus Magasanikbacteria bacterium GW2011_GWC2_42_27]KKT04969.1 MAG: 50S ribosomal protein L19 [Candidatus Magasanikbacteria bacterium GW2011_GWD2_43_18]KKT25091.1 MAG: 50S ribosomal protein L19 [Candidatus Magasanikbacteria bacterium GW2011_GWA2_43_9]
MALKPGMIVKVHQKIKDVNAKGEEKERIQLFEGIILAIKHGKEAGATVTVRKISDGIGVEKIFPIHSPVVDKIELVRQMKVKQARPYFLRDYKKKLTEVRQVKGAVKKEKVENPIAKKEIVEETSIETEAPTIEEGKE